MKEEWLPCPGFEEHLEVSSEGRVRKIKSGNILRGSPERGNYLKIIPSLDGKKDRQFKIHRKVCEAFHGPPPPGKPMALHRNGERQDNRKENLYWGDGADNQKDSVDHGTRRQRGSGCNLARLDEEMVIAIRKRKGDLLRTISADFSITEATVSRILNRKIWRHI